LHSFVLDGYDSQGRFHINWGWGGAGNQYFSFQAFDGWDYFNSTIINVLPIPPITGPSFVCNGNSRTFSLDPAVPNATYSWNLESGLSGNSSSNSISITAPSTGNRYYSISVNVTLGAKIQTSTGAIWVGPPPASGSISAQCKNMGSYYTLIFTVAGDPRATSYQWKIDDVVQTPSGTTCSIIAPNCSDDPLKTDFKVEITKINSCGLSPTVCRKFKFSCNPYPAITPNGYCNIIPEMAQQYNLDMIISPNPAISDVNISIVPQVEADNLISSNIANPIRSDINPIIDNLETYFVTLINEMGRNVLSCEKSGNDFSINIESIPNGVYILKVLNQNSNFKKLIIIQH
jgi:hypothetical protein